MGALILMLALSAGGATTVWQCTAADGTAVYADHPCGAGSRQMSVSPNTVRYSRQPAVSSLAPAKPAGDSGQAAAAQPVKGAKPDCPSAHEMQYAIVSQEIRLCMTMAQVKDAAPPEFVHHLVLTSAAGGSKYIQWYFPQHLSGWPTFVRFRDGKVVGWSNVARQGKQF